MGNNFILSRIILLVLLVSTYSRIVSQDFYKEYINSVIDCDEFNTQVFIKGDSVYLINFIACDTTPYYTNILKYDLKGNYFDRIHIENLIPNVYSGHLIDHRLFLAGVNSDEKPNSKLQLWQGNLEFTLESTIEMDLLEEPKNVQINTIGSVGSDSNKVIYGQYTIASNAEVFSFLLWLKPDLVKDTLMFFDTAYTWSIIGDVEVGEENSIVIVADAAKIVDHITYYYRIIRKYNKNKQKVFEWISDPFGVNEGLPSLTLLDSNTFVIEFISEENSHIHSLMAINMDSQVVWEHVFHIDDPNSLYRINDIIRIDDGGLLCCGTYRNISENNFGSGYLCKLDADGNLIWERVFYDQEELSNPDLGINKVINFNSVVEVSDYSIVVGGRVIHEFLTANSTSDVFLAVLDSLGCLSKNCTKFVDITVVSGLLDPDKIWTEANYDFKDSWSYKFKFDSTQANLGNKIYYELYRAYYENSEIWEPTGIFVREEHGIYYQYYEQGESVIYNLNLAIGDTFHLGNEVIVYDLVVQNIDTITLINGDLKKRWFLEPLNPADPNIDNTIIWIEDIGNISGFLSNYKPWTIDSEEQELLCVYLNNNIIYNNPTVNTCWVMTSSIYDIELEEISVIPNPATNEIRIVGMEDKIISTMVYDNLGNLVLKSFENRISLDSVADGFYYIIIELENSKYKTLGFVKL